MIAGEWVKKKKKLNDGEKIKHQDVRLNHRHAKNLLIAKIAVMEMPMDR